ncbi:peptidase T [Clostridium sp. CF012]|uniref:peptidase T n=1 Tax=Clostridium sp. CF012 TaxID=2843319 RepID=UPI001C0E4E9E|nr:peptidase T [Clostridium sp. CF012]MBU3145207.1 peptidase T [Clostridium sp. CF012]
MSTVVEKFLKYVSYDTKSDEESTTVPSTAGQMKLATELVKELKAMGLQEASVDNNGYVMATIPSNIEKAVPIIGFIAHMDTAPDISGKNINPKFIENYDGEDIILNKENDIVLSPKDFPELKNYIGKTLITTDGTTLLGADDKAGISEIMTMAEYLIENPHIPHGRIRIAFTPDEEVGRGADFFDVKKFDAEFAYTLDGGAIGELEYETFNAAVAKICVHGRNVHPGTAKGRMIHSSLIANEFMNSLPPNETPARTEGYEGFYHLININGEVEEAKLQYIIRDFNKERFEDRKAFIKNISDKLNNRYGNGTVEIEVKDQYFNMKEKIEPVKHIVDTAFLAMKEVGITPILVPFRGGTDGARLSFMGLPTPNIFAGGHNFHGKYEFIPTFAMEKAVEVLLKIVELYAVKSY